MRTKFDHGEDPMDPESQQQHNFHRGFNGFQGFNPFGSGPFNFKFGFNWGSSHLVEFFFLFFFLIFLPFKNGDEGQEECQCPAKEPYNDVRQVVSLNPLTLTEDAPNVVEFYNFAFLLGKVCCYANKLPLSGELPDK